MQEPPEPGSPMPCAVSQFLLVSVLTSLSLLPTFFHRAKNRLLTAPGFHYLDILPPEGLVQALFGPRFRNAKEGL